MNLKATYSELLEKRGKANYSIKELEMHPGAFVGVDSEGRPCFFLATNENEPRPSIVTSLLELHLNTPYKELSVDGETGTGNFHSIRLKSSDKSEVESFLYIVEGFVNNQLPGAILSNSIINFFEGARRLFSTGAEGDLALARQGLWGELFFMQKSRGFRFWAPYWHSEINLTYDFSAPKKRLEVKTTLFQERIHHFSHRQIYSNEEESIVIASMLLHTDDSGLTLRQLIKEAKDALVNTKDYFKLERAVRKAGMVDVSINGPSFNEAEAISNLKWYSASVVPQFRTPEPEGVSETHYKSDLTRAIALTNSEIDEWIASWPVIQPMQISTP